MRVGLAAHEVVVDGVLPEIGERPTRETDQTVTRPEAAIGNLTVDLPNAGRQSEPQSALDRIEFPAPEGLVKAQRMLSLASR